MLPLRFEWDPKKAALNLEKHVVSFQEAGTVFYDECAVEFLMMTSTRNGKTGFCYAEYYHG